MKILFVSPEGLPYSKTGGLADVVEALPKALRQLGHEVAVLLPRYRGNEITATLLSSVTVPVGDGLRFPSICEAAPVDGVRYFLVDDPEYFDRAGLYGEDGKDYPDNAERFTEFCRVAIEVVKRVWLPDVIHCHDWQSGLVPVLIRTEYAKDPVVRSLPVVFTIHNLAYQGLFPRPTLRRIGLRESLFTMDMLEFYGQINFLKGALLHANYLTTVSPRYAKEIQTREYGCALDGVVRKRADQLIGILNGVDYSVWSPEVDPFIAQNYSAEHLEGKQACKADLLSSFGLPAGDLSRPLAGIVSRFVDQKGFDLIADISADLMKENVAFVALGSGQREYERLFQGLSEKYPDRAAVKIGYDNGLAHKVEAGADIFLMPSRYEPCGLNQIYSLRYGTVPVVRATGGLDDTIQSFVTDGDGRAEGTGFKFEPYASGALLGAVRSALRTYENREAWRALQRNGMAKDFSWNSSAREYVSVYELAKRSRIPRAAGTSKSVAK